MGAGPVGAISIQKPGGTQQTSSEPSSQSPGTTTGCAEATEPEHSAFWMESHQQDGRDALGAPLQQKSISQAAEVSL